MGEHLTNSDSFPISCLTWNNNKLGTGSPLKSLGNPLDPYKLFIFNTT